MGSKGDGREARETDGKQVKRTGRESGEKRVSGGNLIVARSV
jgi:hypothetical protein